MLLPFGSDRRATGTGAAGAVVATGGVNVIPTGLQAAGGVGTVTITGTAVVSPTGISATGGVTVPLVWGRIVPNPGTAWTEIAA